MRIAKLFSIAAPGRIPANLEPDPGKWKTQSNAQSHRIWVQIGGLGAQAYSSTPSTEAAEMGP
jgi:hypothetical protein